LFPLRQCEWSFCQEPGCRRSDRVEDVQGGLEARLWLQHLKGDPLAMAILRDLLSNQISLPPSRMVDDTVVEQIAALLISDRLHLHAKETESHAVGGVESPEESAPFPISERQPRASAPPPQGVDPPTFSPKANLSAQAGGLGAAAAAGLPFCQECQNT
jgi:hypothetical protein